MTQQQFQKKPQSTTISTSPELLRSRPFDVESTATQSDVQAEGFGQSFAEMAVQQHSSTIVQPKLTIGKPGDKYEQEADRVAAKVVQKLHNPPSAQKPNQIQTKPVYSQIQRVNSLVQRQPDIDDTVNDEFESSLNNARSGGNALEPQLRMEMESAMGADFSRVKVHTDRKANQLNQSIQAKAFTTGQDIFFRQGEYNPGNRGGQELIAHELTHVVQQGGAISGSVIQCKGVEDIVHEIGTFMKEGELKKADIVEGLQKMEKESIDDPNFAHALVEFVKNRNGSDFKIEDIGEVKVGFGEKHLNKTWTFRHYTKTEYENLRSLAQLENDPEIKNASANTNDKDWEELGNQGYVFGLIAIDGKVPSRSWLSKMEYYAEYNLKELNSVWVSGDMLTEENRKKNSFRGSGKQVIDQLSKMLGFMDQNPEQQLDEKFNKALEAKVPPAELNKGNIEWKKV